MVHVEVGAQHRINFVRFKTRSTEVFEEAGLHFMPILIRHALLVVADAGIHHHGEGGRFHHERVNACDELALSVHKMGDHPGEGLHGLWLGLGQDEGHPSQRFDFHNLRDANVTNLPPLHA